MDLLLVRQRDGAGRSRTFAQGDNSNKDCAVCPVSANRITEPGELARVALFLASDDSSFVNGEILVADGGWTVG